MAKRKSTQPIELSYADQVRLYLLFWDALDAINAISDGRRPAAIYCLYNLMAAFDLTTKAANVAQKNRPTKRLIHMTAADREAYLAELMKKLENMTPPTGEEQRKQAPVTNRDHIDSLITELHDRLGGKTTTPPAEPEQQPHQEDEPALKLPTAKMRKRLATFDDMTDGDQVDALRSLWGEA